MKLNKTILIYAASACIGLSMVVIGFTLSSIKNEIKPSQSATTQENNKPSPWPIGAIDTQPEISSPDNTRLTAKLNSTPNNNKTLKAKSSVRNIGRYQEPMFDNESQLSVTEIREMHDEQLQELQLASNDKFSVESDISVEQINSMHSELSKRNDEVLFVEPNKSNPNGVSVSEIKALHQKFLEKDIGKSTASQYIDIKSASTNSGDLITVSEIESFHNIELSKKKNDKKSVADEANDLPISEIKELHKKEILETKN